MGGGIKIGAYDIDSLKRVKVFTSMQECAVVHNAAVSSVTRAAESGVVFRGKYYLRFAGFDKNRRSDFPLKMTLELNVINNSATKGKMVKLKPYYNFNDEIKFRSMTSAGQYLGFTRRRVLHLIESQEMIIVDGEKYQIRFVESENYTKLKPKIFRTEEG